MAKCVILDIKGISQLLEKMNVCDFTEYSN